ncbi:MULTISPECIES: sulfite exporter TauE/SafE family protein [Pseudomonas]|uniref:Probable membrane transporter protein n=1 Tax=Pseudomonas saxonica TaxID=2600598 RepID=A0A5C5PVB6_9PSED|nr:MULTISPECIES: sulfite exporter TauE/SafE family protein [Pseudomonas]MCH4873626.1 sulfite exporter TauE/SafE family protein [Pseudomonas sp. TMW22091]TWR85173.1 sulfite exporter TauE/SafE family protein [Pseudomonas saxonica]TWR90883.1 sulfite exporter TauE/SafE family protein [Pseudomonas saxonica]
MLIILLGVLVGLLLGLTGAGGGILAIPALTLGLGWTLLEATPVALLAVGMAAAVGALDGLRKGLVRYKAAGLMAGAGWLASPVGLYLAKLLPAAALMTLFAAIMMFVSGRMFRQAADGCSEIDAAHGKNCRINPDTGRLVWDTKCSTTLACIGAVSGLLTGLLGVGGGFLIVPAFRRFSDVPMHGIVATSLMVVALVSLGTLAHLLYQGVSLSGEASVFIGATLAGMIVGRLIAPKVSGKRMQQGFAVVCAIVSVLMLVKVALIS